MNIDDLLLRLNNVKQNSTGFTARCPAHDDRRNSLSVNQADGKILLHCHAGCSTESVLNALGLKMSDLFAEPSNNGQKATIVATYDYRDGNGMLLYQTVRYSPKDFRQRRPDGSGGWIWNLGETQRVLYRLAELVKADPNDWIFVVEGEKDADNLAALGLVATTNVCGAGKWRDEYNQYLAGRKVCILPDNDTAGKIHAEKVARSLHGVAAEVRIVKLPGLLPKGDVSDWLSNGGTKDELLRLVESTAAYEPKPEPEGTREAKRKRELEDDDEVPARFTSLYVNGNAIYEQIASDKGPAFIAYDASSGEVRKVREIALGVEIVKPLVGEDIELGVVKLPSDATEYGDTLTLLAEIEDHIERYLDVSPSYRKFAAYYILLSWLYDRFNTLPYLRALGDTGCGKSRFLDVIGGLCYKPISASGCVTPAPIYRMLKRWAGTLILDEADMKNSDEYNEVVTILNCGFERNRPVIRALKDNPEKVQILPVYGPKVFATRRRFQDIALEARCLTEIMRETDRDDIPPVLGRKFEAEQQELRNKLLLFRLRNYFSVQPEATVELRNIEPRLQQVSQAFLALLASEPDALAAYRQFIVGHQRELIEQRASTKVGQVVEALLDALEGNKVTMVTTITGDSVVDVTAAQIAEKVGLTHQGVGQILKNLGVRTKLIKIGGEVKRRILYDASVFAKLRKRYVVGDDSDESSVDALSTVTDVTLVTLVTSDSVCVDCGNPLAEDEDYQCEPCRLRWLESEVNR